MPNGQRKMLSALKLNGLIFENIGGFALTAINVNHDFLQVFPLIKSEFFSSTYLPYLLKSKFINLMFFSSVDCILQRVSWAEAFDSGFNVEHNDLSTIWQATFSSFDNHH